MKKYAILLLFLVSISSCKKIDKLTQFDIDLENNVTIRASIPINTPLDIPTPPISTNSEDTFDNNNTSKDLIEKAILKKMKLTITNPSRGNFDFIKNIEIYISADNLPEVKMAWKLNHTNDGKNTLNLDTSSDDLQEYIKKNQINIRVRTTTDEILTQDYDVKIEYTFSIDAEILGI